MLDELFDARLHDPRLEVRVDLRYCGGEHLIAGIRLAVELTGLDISAAKQRIESRDWLLHDITLAEATLIEQRFAAVGSRVEIVSRSASIIAFDPRHPDRAWQPLQRMCVTGKQLAIEEGRFDAWRPATAIQSFDDPEDLHAAIATRLDAWTRAGLELEVDPIAFIVRTSAREAALEQAIRSAEDPREALLVYGDWLLAQGDPRGELGPLQTIGGRAFEHALAWRGAMLLGPYARIVVDLQLEWQVGMVRRLAWAGEPRPGERTSLADLRALLRLPVMTCLRELSVRGVWLAGDPVAAIPIELRAGLRCLSLGTARFATLQVASWAGLERLEVLELGFASVASAAPMLPALRRLQLQTTLVDEALVATFTPAQLGALEELVLQLDFAPQEQEWTGDYTDRLRELLRAPSLATIRRFTLRVDAGALDSRAIAALFEACFVGGLEQLELIAHLDDAALDVFERRCAEHPELDIRRGQPS